MPVDPFWKMLDVALSLDVIGPRAAARAHTAPAPAPQATPPVKRNRGRARWGASPFRDVERAQVGRVVLVVREPVGREVVEVVQWRSEDGRRAAWGRLDAVTASQEVIVAAYGFVPTGGPL